ncbi:dihydrolipoyl dehydrogenase [Candidatus Woesearchaeota archaeon]|nr:dihydrolipoyl dehydrogenase [Candidatus Woesearchaeota archaeon]
MNCISPLPNTKPKCLLTIIFFNLNNNGVVKITEYDAVIIGSGPAGYTCAIRVSQLGGKAAVIEKDLTGGICTNWGCIPTKAMITSAKIVDTIKKSSRFGIDVKDFEIDFKKITKHRDRTVKISRKGIETLLKKNDVDLIHGQGKIISDNEVKVDDKTIKAKNIVVATGSSPIIPGFIKLGEDILSSKELLQIKEIPEKLIIVGGGVIGLEFATLFSILGSEVTIVEMMERLLVNADPEISKELEKAYSRKKINIFTKHKVLSAKSNSVEIEDMTEGKKLTLKADKILVAIGRRANVDKEEMENNSIKYSKTGIKVDNHMRTNKKNIYAIGDITGKSILAHVGIQQAVVAAENIMGKNTKMNYVVPACIYTIPEVAEVGANETEVDDTKVGKFPMIVNARARGEGHTTGFIKVVIKDDLLVGCQMIGHNVTELISEAAVIIKNKISCKEILKTIHPHPTYAESIKGAIEDAYKEAIDLMPKKN